MKRKLSVLYKIRINNSWRYFHMITEDGMPFLEKLATRHPNATLDDLKVIETEEV